MRFVLLALCATLACGPAHAISTYNPTKMTCDKLKATVKQQGAVMLRWTSKMTPGVPRWGRYVRDSSFCNIPDRATDTLVPAQDRSSCRVSICRPYFPDDGGLNGR